MAMTNIQDIGINNLTTAKEQAFKYGKMVQSTKECGKATKPTDMAD